MIPLLRSRAALERFKLPALRCCPNSIFNASHVRFRCISLPYVGLQPPIVFFSRSSALHVRNTYFPRGPPGGGSHPKEGPFSRMKRIINTLPSNVILWTVLGLNGVVYLLWNVGIDRAVSVPYPHAHCLTPTRRKTIKICRF